ncbi:MAG: hypothetical protein BWY68_00521 [bacterium ADurb.Bin400]|nr:MAG: hypothetical protein BWY68_00521 [bacterium ADurb.Bin400]
MVDYQPYDGIVSVEGWFTLPSDPTGFSSRRIHFNEDVIRGTSTTRGRANFVISSYDWPDNWQSDGTAMLAGISYYFMITVEEPNGRLRRVTEVWRIQNGVVDRIS